MFGKFLATLLSLVMMASASEVAFAAAFTPSVEAKPAPLIVPIMDSAGTTVDAIVYDAKGKEVIGIPTGKLKVTPISDANHATENIKNMLETAYNQINTPDFMESQRTVLDPNLREFSDGTKIEDLAVMDLFDVSIPEKYETYITHDGNRMTVRFDVDLSQNTPLIAMINCNILEGEAWHAISPDNINRNQDGSVSITFDKFCPVIFLTDPGQLGTDPNGPKSPQTSDNVYRYIIIVAVMGVFAVAFVENRRKHKASH